MENEFWLAKSLNKKIPLYVFLFDWIKTFILVGKAVSDGNEKLIKYEYYFDWNQMCIFWMKKILDKKVVFFFNNHK